MAGLPELLERQAETHPSRVALQGPDSAFTYAQMMQAARALADQLIRLGVRRAGLCGDNSVAWVLADLACLLADVVHTLARRTGWCYASRDYLARIFVSSVRSVQRDLAELELRGLVERQGKRLRTTPLWQQVTGRDR